MNTTLCKRLATALLSMGLMTFGGAAFAQYGPQYGPPGPPPPPPQYGMRGWDAPPGELREFQRRGFLDGVQGAERDFQNHRIWNVNNRDEFRHPQVPGKRSRRLSRRLQEGLLRNRAALPGWTRTAITVWSCRRGDLVGSYVLL